MKKIIATMMIVTLSMSTAISAFAKEPALNPEVSNLIEMGATEILDVETISENEKTFVAMYGDIENVVTEKQDKTGTYYTFEQDDLKNEIFISNDGEMYLDGTKVEISVTDIDANVGQEECAKAATPRAFYDYWEYAETPFASGSYTYGEQTNMVAAELGRDIVSITLGAFTTAVVFAISGGSAVYTGASLFSPAVFKEIIRQVDPAATSVYLKRTTWHNNKPDLTSSVLYH